MVPAVEARTREAARWQTGRLSECELVTKRVPECSRPAAIEAVCAAFPVRSPSVAHGFSSLMISGVILPGNYWKSSSLFPGYVNRDV